MHLEHDLEPVRWDDGVIERSTAAQTFRNFIYYLASAKKRVCGAQGAVESLRLHLTSAQTSVPRPFRNLSLSLFVFEQVFLQVANRKAFRA